MGLYQDNFTGLSELERLAAMAHDPVRVREIGEDQWPLAMMACGLMSCNNPEASEENYGIYRVFAEKTSVSARKSSLTRLSSFITARKGEGWQALLPYALSEPDPGVASKASLCAILLAKPSESRPLEGAEALASGLLKRPVAAPGAVLSAMLGMSDMRFLPLMESLIAEPTEEKLRTWLDAVLTTPNRLSCTWLCRVLEARPALSAAVADALCRIAPLASTVADIVYPVPTWAFKNPTPQPLHGWTRAEYFARMAPDLEGRVSAENFIRIREAFG